MKRMYHIITAALVASALFMAACTGDKGDSQSTASTSDSDSVTVAADDTAQAPVASQPQPPKGEVVVQGVAIDGAHESMILQDASGKEYDFDCSNVDPSQRDAWQIDDTLRVTYVPTPGTGDVDHVVSVRQVHPAK